MKILSKILISLLLVIGVGFAYFIYNFGPIISGFGAKAVCSCVYVGNRNVQSVIDNELSAFPLSLGEFVLNESDSSASGSLFGLSQAKAIYRKGMGCTLVREISEETLRESNYNLSISTPLLSDTLYWPQGTRMADTVPKSVDVSLLKTVLDASFLNTHEKLPANTRAVLVVYKGQLIAEKYAPEFDRNSVQLGWSFGKSVTSGIMGVLVQKGMMDINEPAPVDAWKNESDPRHNITTKSLLTMTSGLHWEEVYSNVSTATNMLYKYADMGAFASDQPKEFEIDEKWCYSSGSSNIISKIIRDKVGQQAYYNFAHQELFNKIGITSMVMEPDASGTIVGSSYMWATARDWARFGQLYLNNGRWFGTQLLPESWVEFTVTPAPNTPKQEYGAQWWLNRGEIGKESNRLLPNVPTDMYMMDGYEGQRVFVVPSKDLVVVRLGQNKIGGFDYDAFLSGVIQSLN